ncbi:MAG TPA: 16S rRNA (guanine(527)-N(7))-methyltransferase RsmG [Candidatus Acidoferrum sp.]|jgi:16S rRNA (guanine527-N7)-methyltransferase|nr:16S rRNA (guanine(527)-N(7))-methyltransferase RsmG [Candidatus Acidoferrum sp.]
MTEVPPAAEAIFGDRLELAERYVRLLATDGIEFGLIGPRERDRLWDRHILNCAVVAELINFGSSTPRLVDVGSGAGLPGLVLAILRPELTVQLVEPLERRTRFLADAVKSLKLEGQVEVVRGRANDKAVVAATGSVGWVTARAVAPLNRLAGWCLPLLRRGGSLLALKGVNAPTEILSHADEIQQMGAMTPELVYCGTDLLDDPVRVVVVRRR